MINDGSGLLRPLGVARPASGTHVNIKKCELASRTHRILCLGEHDNRFKTKIPGRELCGNVVHGYVRPISVRHHGDAR